jgi:hypothetical protein
MLSVSIHEYIVEASGLKTYEVYCRRYFIQFTLLPIHEEYSPALPTNCQRNLRPTFYCSVHYVCRN